MKCKSKKCIGESRVQSPFCSERCQGAFNVAARRRKLKTLAIEHKGGCCQHCGYNKSVRALTFHHLDPSKKEFNVGGKGETRSWEKVKAEIDKCILLCMNCHMEVTHTKVVKNEDI